MLVSNKYTGTGLNYRDLSDEDISNLTLGRERLCGPVVLGNANPSGGIPKSYIENSTEDNRIYYGFVDVATYNAMLRMTN